MEMPIFTKFNWTKTFVEIKEGIDEYELKQITGGRVKRVRGLWMRTGLNIGIDLSDNAAPAVLTQYDNAIRVTQDLRLVNEQLFQSTEIELRQDNFATHEKVPLQMFRDFCSPLMGGYVPLDLDNCSLGKSKLFIKNKKLIQAVRKEAFEFVWLYEKLS